MVSMGINPFDAFEFIRDNAKKEYPFNEEFWGQGRRFANDISSRVGLQSPIDMAIESVSEAAAELTGGAGDLLKEVVPDIDLPDVSGFMDTLKWMTFLGIGGLVAYKLWQRRQ
jgi:hypothetical protein